MTNQEILTKAIKKAIDGGWAKSPSGRKWDKPKSFEVLGDVVDFNWDDPRQRYRWQTTALIFNYDFAKALWPPMPEIKCPHCHVAIFSGLRHPSPCPFSQMVIGDIQPWKYHLQQMVIADDPIKYLEANYD